MRGNGSVGWMRDWECQEGRPCTRPKGAGVVSRLRPGVARELRRGGGWEGSWGVSVGTDWSEVEGSGTYPKERGKSAEMCEGSKWWNARLCRREWGWF